LSKATILFQRKQKVKNLTFVTHSNDFQMILTLMVLTSKNPWPAALAPLAPRRAPGQASILLFEINGFALHGFAF
jgi:hypothetical protein